MEAAQQQKAAAAANGGRAASGQPQMRDSPNDNRGGKFNSFNQRVDQYKMEILVFSIIFKY